MEFFSLETRLKRRILSGMKTDLIKAIFTNLLFVIGVILVIFGFVNGVSTVTKSIVFEKYPINTYDETRCESEFMNQPVTAGPDGKTVPVTEGSTEEKKERLKKCTESVELSRKVKQTEDIVSSITTFISGSILIYSFRKFIFH